MSDSNVLDLRQTETHDREDCAYALSIYMPYLLGFIHVQNELPVRGDLR
jgi:hypothetical protein